jgi:hypothetical protein
MLTRTSRKTATFANPFRLKCLDRTLPAGAYSVVTDEELIEGLSFPVYRRTSTMMMVPQGEHGSSSAIEMIPINPDDLKSALERDNAGPGDASKPNSGDTR